MATETPVAPEHATQDAGQGSASDEGKQDAEKAPVTPESWFGALPEDAKPIAQQWHEAQVAGLKTALGSERDERKADRKQFQTQLTEAIAKASGEGKAELEKIQASMNAAGSRADFFADAHEAGVLDLRTAWAAVKEYDLHDRKGNPDLEALKTKCPYLFQPTSAPPPRVNAGAGGHTPPAPANEDPIRAALRRRQLS
jgi:hypothetical protein